jgi:Fis family transcriptional regulator
VNPEGKDVVVKDHLENLVLQMYKAGVRCSEAVREFQKAFILTVLKDQRGNQCKAAKKLGVHRNTLRRTIRDLDIDIGPTRAMGSRRPPRSEVPLPSVRRRAT